MLQIMLEALRIGDRLSFKVCYHVNGLRNETSFPFPKRLLSRTYLIQDPVTAFCNCLFVCLFVFCSFISWPKVIENRSSM